MALLAHCAARTTKLPGRRGPQEPGTGMIAEPRKPPGTSARVRQSKKNRKVMDRSGVLLADELAAGVAAGLERLFGLFRSLNPPSGLSLTAAATLATLERSGPCRLTWLAVREGVTQPAMTQLVGRLQEAGLAGRAPDPADGRVVRVCITDKGREILARRRAARGAARRNAGPAEPRRTGCTCLGAARDGRTGRRPPRGPGRRGSRPAGLIAGPALHATLRYLASDGETLMTGAAAGTAASPFKQPKAVFAVALACVVSFMGIGLVDPILPAISPPSSHRGSSSASTTRSPPRP